MYHKIILSYMYWAGVKYACAISLIHSLVCLLQLGHMVVASCLACSNACINAQSPTSPCHHLSYVLIRSLTTSLPRK